MSAADCSRPGFGTFHLYAICFYCFVVVVVVVVVVVMTGLCYILWVQSLNFCMQLRFDHKVEFMACQELKSSEVSNLTFSAMNFCTETPVQFGHNTWH